MDLAACLAVCAKSGTMKRNTSKRKVSAQKAGERKRLYLRTAFPKGDLLGSRERDRCPFAALRVLRESGPKVRT